MRGFLTILLCLAGIASAQQAGSGSDNGFTVARADRDAYSQPAPVLSYRESETFLQGRSHFKRRWIAPITFNGEWGLGPRSSRPVVPSATSAMAAAARRKRHANSLPPCWCA